jgi:hypothetical protein
MSFSSSESLSDRLLSFGTGGGSALLLFFSSE